MRLFSNSTGSVSIGGTSLDATSPELLRVAGGTTDNYNLIGAYGNVGSVLFLTLLSLTGPTPFFITMAGAALVAFGCCFLLKEPARVAHVIREEQSAELSAAVAVGA